MSHENTCIFGLNYIVFFIIIRGSKKPIERFQLVKVGQWIHLWGSPTAVLLSWIAVMNVRILSLVFWNWKLIENLNNLLGVTDKMFRLRSSPSNSTRIHIDIRRNTEALQFLHDEIELWLIVCESQLQNLNLKLLHFRLNSVQVFEYWLSLTIVSDVENKINFFLLKLFDTVFRALLFNQRSYKFIL